MRIQWKQVLAMALILALSTPNTAYAAKRKKKVQEPTTYSSEMKEGEEENISELVYLEGELPFGR